MSPDILAIYHRQHAKRTAQTPADYSCAIEIHKRRTGIAEYAVWCAVALGFAVAITAGALT